MSKLNLEQFLKGRNFFTFFSFFALGKIDYSTHPKAGHCSAFEYNLMPVPIIPKPDKNVRLLA
jgi:hypothetical protein